MPDTKFEEWLDEVIPDVVSMIPKHLIAHSEDTEDARR